MRVYDVHLLRGPSRGVEHATAACVLKHLHSAGVDETHTGVAPVRKAGEVQLLHHVTLRHVACLILDPDRGDFGKL